MNMKEQTFGFELEFFGMTRYNAARVVAEYLNGDFDNTGRGYSITAADGRVWKVCYDGSVSSHIGECCELVSPILNYGDIETLQEIVRELRKNGAKVDNTCGIHIHIGADVHNAKSLKNLSNLFYSKQDILYKALDVLPRRAERYTKKLPVSFIQNLKSKNPKEVSKFADVWYGSLGNGDARDMKYNESRYHGLNFHATFYTGTVEFRIFNATLHAGKVKAYIQLCLAMSAQAINQRSVSSVPMVSSNEKYTFRTWLLRLGLIGDEFKTARLHLLANLDGDSAFRNGRQAN